MIVTLNLEIVLDWLASLAGKFQAASAIKYIFFIFQKKCKNPCLCNFFYFFSELHKMCRSAF